VKTDRTWADLDCSGDGLQSRNTTNLSDAYITITEALHTYFSIGDMGEDGYRSMLCVESANTADNRIMIAPNGSHTLSVCYSVKNQCSGEYFPIHKCV